eukprot:13774-Heterococcus_DN1.PRE.1
MQQQLLTLCQYELRVRRNELSADQGDEAASDDECDETVNAVTATNSAIETDAIADAGTATATAGADIATAGATDTATTGAETTAAAAGHVAVETKTAATATDATDAAVPTTAMAALHIDSSNSSTTNDSSISSSGSSTATKEQYWYALERGNGSKLVGAALDAKGWKRITTTDTAPEQPA